MFTNLEQRTSEPSSAENTRQGLVRELVGYGIPEFDLRYQTDDELQKMLNFYTSHEDFGKKKQKTKSSQDMTYGNFSNVHPPANLQGEELKKWWENQLSQEGLLHIPTTGDYERLCLKCRSLNPCTGVDTCGQCGTDITPETGAKNFVRVENSNLHSPSGQR